MNRILLAACALLLLGAGKVPVTVVKAKVEAFELWERSVGHVEAQRAPWISAEVGGRIARVLAEVGDRVKAGQVLAVIDPEDLRLAQRKAEAEVKRLEALLHGQRLKVRRLEALVAKKLADPSSLDDAKASLGALEAGLDAARAGLAEAQRALLKTRIAAPFAGIVDRREVSAGDFVDKGAPLFRIVDPQRLQAWLPFPEALRERLRPGLEVLLETPASPYTVRASITALRPALGEQSRAVFALVAFADPGGFAPGASVTGKVKLGVLEEAVVVPEIAVVSRPAGHVVYVIEEGKAEERQVTLGPREGGMAVILQGLAGAEIIAADGAGFLTDGARVEVR